MKQTDKTQPHDKLAEMAVASAILFEKYAFSVARTFVDKQAFYFEANTLIFEACEELFASNSTIDMISVSRQLRSKKNGNSNNLEVCGGNQYLADLSDVVSSASNLEFHCRVIMEMWMRRCIISVSYSNANRGFDLTSDVFDLLSKSQGELSKITEKLTVKKPESIANLAFEVISDIENGENEPFWVPTGINGFDSRVKICGSDLVIIAARPGMGKSSFVVTAMLNMGIMGRRGIMFSLEMSNKQIVQKFLSAHSDVAYWKLRERKCDDYEREKLAESYGHIRHMSSMIIDSSGLTIEEIKAITISENSKSPIEYVIIDFLQIIRMSSGGNRDQQLGHVTTSAKSLAKQLNIPVIILSQLSRDVEKRGGDKRPILSDLRESGNIEQDADTVVFLYRPEYYGIEVDEQNEPTKNTCEVDFAKNRHGGTGVVKINCQMDIGKFW